MENFGLIAAFLHANLINKVIFVALILISIYSWGVVFAKITWFKFAIYNLQQLQDSLSDIKEYNAIKIFTTVKPKNLYINVLEAIIQKQDYNSALNNVNIKHNAKLDFLASVSSIAPFVGLLGTVVGVIDSFSAIGVTKSASLAVIAPGIAEALYATAVGLFAAIPALWFYNKFSNKNYLLQDQQDVVFYSLYLKYTSLCNAMDNLLSTASNELYQPSNTNTNKKKNKDKDNSTPKTNNSSNNTSQTADKTNNAEEESTMVEDKNV